MSNLVFKQEDQILTESVQISKNFNKQHHHILRDIDALKKDVPNFGEMFFASKGRDSYGRFRRTYLMNRDGFTLLAMGFTGKEALEFKLKYIKEFNEMEKELNKPMSPSELALLQAQNIYGLEKKVNSHEDKIKKLDDKVTNQITLSYQEQRKVQKSVARRVYEMFDADNRPKGFGSLYSEIKDRFGVGSYKDLKRVDLQLAVNYINNWIPKRD